MKTWFPVWLIFTICCSSCISFKPVASYSPQQDGFAYSEIPTAYVINADTLRTEYKILKASKRYHLTQDPTAGIHIELKEMEYSSLNRCITPQITVLAFTLGFFPVKFSDTYLFQYDEKRENEKIRRQYYVELEKTVSWFHLFSPKKSKRRAIARGISSKANISPAFYRTKE